MRWRDPIFALVVICQACSAPGSVAPGTSDTIRVGLMPAGIECGALVDGKRPGGAEFVDHVVVGTTSILELGDVRSRGTTESALLFAQGRQPGHAAPTWSSAAEEISIPMKRAIKLPVTFWIVEDSEVSSLRPWWCFVTANRIFHDERFGVKLTRGTVESVSLPRGVTMPFSYDCTYVETKPSGAWGDKDIRQLGYSRSKINVYFVKRVLKSLRGGQWCKSKSPRTILLGSRCAAQLLAHEVAHMFDLHHPDTSGASWRAGFDEKNVMASSSGHRRKYFAEGQTFRAHFSDDSCLNRPGWLGSAAKRSGLSLFLKRWDADERVPFGDYPPACWRIWADGAFAASIGPAATTHCPHDMHPSPSGSTGDSDPAGGPPPTPPGASFASRYVRFTCPVGETVDLDAQLRALGAQSAPAFEQIAKDGLTAVQRAEVTAAAQETFRANRRWLALPIAAQLVPAATRRRLQSVRESDYVAQAVEDVETADRVRALGALVVVRSVRSLPHVRPLTRDPNQEVAAAAAKTVRALGG